HCVLSIRKQRRFTSCCPRALSDICKRSSTTRTSIRVRHTRCSTRRSPRKTPMTRTCTSTRCSFPRLRFGLVCDFPPWSGDDRRYDVAVNVSQAEIAAGVTVGQLLVIEPQQVQDRRVQIVHVNFVLDRAEAEIVGRPVGGPALHPAASQPRREAPVIVIAPISAL